MSAMSFMGLIILVSANILIHSHIAVKAAIPFTEL
jgi:hypothetical protein